MTSLACNIVILPSEELSEQAIKLSRQLADKGTLFTLRNGSFYPHVSVYMLQLKSIDLETAGKQLAEIAKQTAGISLTASKYYQAAQFFDAEYEKPDVLGQLQDTVIAALNPIRDGMRAKDVVRMKEASGLALENFKQYGWNTIGDLYRPHLTLTRFNTDQAVTSLTLPEITDFSGVFPKLGLFEMGDNGTCVRKIAEFDLQPLK